MDRFLWNDRISERRWGVDDVATKSAYIYSKLGFLCLGFCLFTRVKLLLLFLMFESSVRIVVSQSHKYK